MHEENVTSESAAFAKTLANSGLSSAEIEKLLMVSQSTVSRLKAGLIRDVGRHASVFGMRQRERWSAVDLDEVVKDLARRGKDDPAFGRLLIQLSDLMQNA